MHKMIAITNIDEFFSKAGNYFCDTTKKKKQQLQLGLHTVIFWVR